MCFRKSRSGSPARCVPWSLLRRRSLPAAAAAVADRARARRRAPAPAARRAADRPIAGRRPGGARSRPRAVGEPLHRLPRLAGARIGHRSEHHPDEDRELRSQRRRGGQRARAVPEGGSPDAEPEAERVVHRRGGRRRWRTSSGSASTTRCAARPCSRSATSSLAIAKAGEAYFNGDGGCATCHNATDAQPGRRRHAHSCTGRSAAAHALPRWRRTGTRPRRRARRGRPPAVAPRRRQPSIANAVTVTIAPASGAADVRRARGRERLLRHAA